jgi:hypothetical protein
MTRHKKTTDNVNRVRERRSQVARNTSNNSQSQNVISERKMPPVMVRGSGYNQTLQKKHGKRKAGTKRRYDIALPTPGVEIRLPSIPAVKLGWRVISFSLVAIFIWLLNYLLTSPIFQVQTVEVQGAIRLSLEEIANTLNLNDKPVFILDPTALEFSLERTYPELTDISVQIGLPAQVSISVSERVPMIAWVNDSETVWIDGNGYVFNSRGDVDKLVKVFANTSPPLSNAIVEDNESMGIPAEDQGYVQPEFVSAIFSLRSQTPEGADLIYDSNHGFGWIDSRGWKVYFGMDVHDINMKLLVYGSIVEKLQLEGLTPSLISLEQVHAPYYRME